MTALAHKRVMDALETSLEAITGDGFDSIAPAYVEQFTFWSERLLESYSGGTFVIFLEPGEETHEESETSKGMSARCEVLIRLARRFGGDDLNGVRRGPWIDAAIKGVLDKLFSDPKIGLGSVVDNVADEPLRIDRSLVVEDAAWAMALIRTVIRYHYIGGAA